MSGNGIGQGKLSPPRQDAKGRAGAGTISTRPLTAQSQEDIRLGDLAQSVVTLAGICTQAISQGLQHYRAAESWTVGTLPDFAVPADNLERQIQALLGHSQLLPGQFQAARDLVKCVAALRGAFCGTRCATQLSWLLQNESARTHLTPLICSVGDASLAIAQRATVALTRKDAVAAREAQTLLPFLHATRRDCEYAARMEIRADVPSRRIARAAVWGFAISGEEMARLASGVVLRAAEW